jgi:hypothetical protein
MYLLGKSASCSVMQVDAEDSAFRVVGCRIGLTWGHKAGKERKWIAGSRGDAEGGRETSGMVLRRAAGHGHERGRARST